MKFLKNLFLLLVLFAGAVTPVQAVSPAYLLLLNGGCDNGSTVSIDFTTGKTCGPAALTVTRNTVGYANDSAGNYTQFAVNTLRRTDLGALIEEARTNSIRNNSMQGAVVGSPGTLPTNWAAVGTGLTFTVVAIGVENGIDYIDIRINGTTGSTSGAVRFETTTGIAASSGQTWTGTFFLAVVAGATTNISSLGVANQGLTSGGVITTDNAASTLSLPYTISSLSPSSRQTKTTVLADATDANIRSQLNLGYSSGVAIDVTFRIGWPQLELGAFATSPIRTTVAAVARSQDIVSAPITIGSAVSMYFEAVSPPLNSTNTKSVGGVTDGVSSIANSVWGYFSTVSTSFVSARVINAGVGVDDGNIAVPVGNSFKTAFALANGDSQGATNGTLQTAGTQAFPAGMNTLMVGQVFGRPLDERVKAIKVWTNARISNAMLQTLTQ